MKKGILLLFLFILWNGVSAQSSKPVAVVRTGARAAATSSVSSVAKVLPSRAASLSPVTGRVQSIPLNSTYVRKTHQELRELYEEPNNKIDLEIQHPFIRSTFQAHNTTTGMLNTFSGTVFKTEYEGKKEIWLVITTHSIGEDGKNNALAKNFVIDVYFQREFISIPAQVVQLGAPSLADVSLVKIDPKYEYLFKPLPLSPALPQKNECLSSYGFVAEHSLVEIPDRWVQEVSPQLFYTSLSWPRVFRPGMCGSAVVNSQGQIMGIHTGSTAREGRKDIGYVVPALYLRRLVEAYHHEGKTMFPFLLDGHQSANLRMDEYVSGVALLDEHNEVLWAKNVEHKFPYHEVTRALRGLPVKQVVLQIGRVQWSEQYPGHLFYKDNERRTQYDMQTRQEVAVTFMRRIPSFLDWPIE